MALPCSYDIKAYNVGVGLCLVPDSPKLKPMKIMGKLM